MKLFIWNLEYDVLMAIAETVDEARNLIHAQNEQQRIELKRLDDDMFEGEGLNKKLNKEKHWVWHKLCETNGYVGNDELMAIDNCQPDIELPVNEKMARIYSHSNE